MQLRLYRALRFWEGLLASGTIAAMQTSGVQELTPQILRPPISDGLQVVTFLSGPVKASGGIALLFVLVFCITPNNAAAAAGGPFAEFPGSWSGDGTITLASGDKERLRCRASYRVGSISATDLDLKLGCASDSYKFDFTGNAKVDAQGDITGQWSEASRNVGGGIVGTARGERIQVLIESSGFSAELMMTTRAGRQSITIQLRGGGETSSASMILRRQSR